MTMNQLLGIVLAGTLALTSEASNVRGARGNDELTKHFLLEDETIGEDSHPLQRNFLDGMLDETRFEESLMQSHRTLDECVINQGDIDYFDIEIDIRTQGSPDNCALADTVMLGHDLNRLLRDYGVGASGANDGVVFLAGVCPQPTTDRRKLGAVSFIYTGIGGCRYCPPDNGDTRMLFKDEQSDETQHRELVSQWFTDEFKPNLEDTLMSAINNELAPAHRGCLGFNPVIDIEVLGQNIENLQNACSNNDSGDLEFLRTFNLADIQLRRETGNCGTCVSLDFSTNANNETLDRGDWVQWQYYDTYGLKISAYGGYSKNSSARIFDTSNPGSYSKGDPDLGSPNEDCPDGGVGKGDGGAPGKNGENCVPVGNVLIINESDDPIPDDNRRGGRLVFEFEEPVLISDIGMMDIDETEQKLRFTYDGGEKQTFGYEGFGNNSVQRVIANKHDVKKLEVVLAGSGAVTELNFCPKCD